MQPPASQSTTNAPRRLSAGHVTDAELIELLRDVAEPVIRSVLRRKFGSSPTQRDVTDEEDVHSETKQRLTRALRSAARPEIDNFAAYVARLTNVTWVDYLREKYPNRYRAETQFRYLVSDRSPCKDFACWTGVLGQELVGLAEWKGRSMPETEALRDFVANPERFVESKAISAQSPREALAELLALVAAPMPIEAACRVAPQLWGLPDAPAASEIPEVADAAAGAQEAAHWNECLRWAWREIGAMPPKHRAALLLNSDLPLELVAAGVASIRSMADALEIPAAEFAQLWKDIPLEDIVIAARLGLQRQQVINLRMIARRWLKPQFGKFLAERAA